MAGFSFTETMTGTLRDVRPQGTGAENVMSFTGTAQASSLRQYWRDGFMQFRGTIDAPPFCHATAARGVMRLRPVVERVIEYHLDFVGDDGQPYRFDGKKSIVWADAARTWTTLPGEIVDANRKVVASCALRFNLKHDSVSFLGSFRPW